MFLWQLFFLLDCKANELKSKEIYVDDIKVDDSKFEIKDYYIKIKFAKITNGQFRKIKVIQVIEKEFVDYSFQNLILNEKDVLVKFLIYGVDNIKVDDISNKNCVLDKELNLAYFEGKKTNETMLQHVFIIYSKKLIIKFINIFLNLEKKKKK